MEDTKLWAQHIFPARYFSCHTQKHNTSKCKTKQLFPHPKHNQNQAPQHTHESERKESPQVSEVLCGLQSLL